MKINEGCQDWWENKTENFHNDILRIQNFIWLQKPGKGRTIMPVVPRENTWAQGSGVSSTWLGFDTPCWSASTSARASLTL